MYKAILLYFLCVLLFTSIGALLGYGMYLTLQHTIIGAGLGAFIGVLLVKVEYKN